MRNSGQNPALWTFIDEVDAVNEILWNVLAQCIPNEVVWNSLKGFVKERDVKGFLLLGVLFEQQTSGMNCVGITAVLHKSGLSHVSRRIGRLVKQLPGETFFLKIGTVVLRCQSDVNDLVEELRQLVR